MNIQKLTLVILFFVAGGFIHAQIGINTTNPHPSAALDVDGALIKGLLIPKMEKSNRGDIKQTAAQGLLVRDPSSNMFFFFDGQNWIALNPVQALDGGDTVKLSANYQVVKFDNNMIVGKTLTVNGKTTILDSVKIDKTLDVSNNTTLNTAIITGKLTATNEIDADTNKITAGSVNVGSNTKITGNKIVVDTLYATIGTIPVGGIIMWSGNNNDIPAGWALCNGQTSAEGYTTPDLRGRFVVGYGPNKNAVEGGTAVPDDVWDDNYKTAGRLSKKTTTKGKTGGEKEHTLTIEEMPRHRHVVFGQQNDAKGTGTVRELTNDPGDNDPRYSSYEGNDEAHENRPPYYVLAFIMRVK